MCGWTWRAPKLMTGSGSAAVDAFLRCGGPAGRLREHPEDRGLVQAEGSIVAPDAEHDLLRLEGVAVGERLDGHLTGGRILERVGEQHLGLVDAAEDAAVTREDLHDDDRVEALAREDLLRAPEIDVGGVPGKDADRRPPALHHDTLHQGRECSEWQTPWRPISAGAAQASAAVGPASSPSSAR